ncbi:uncharacterized protein [Aristolochia californica]|uniref:uncharacterized protein n=1 Tax=Aristolochia californica TaxID=171875 RepID=UPI0035E1075B
MARESNIVVSDRTIVDDSSSPTDMSNQQFALRMEEFITRAIAPPAYPHHHPPPPPPPMASLCPAHPVPRGLHTNNPSTVPSVTTFFNQRTQPEDRVPLAAFHMLDEVNLWYHQFKTEHPVHDWEFFRDFCMLRFGAPARRNLLGDLVNLKQTGTIETYQKQFQERLARASPYVRSNQYVNLFTAGLVEALRLEVELHDPPSLVHAMNLARMLDTKQRILKDSMGHRPPWPSQAATGNSYGHNSPMRQGTNPIQTIELSQSTPPPQYIKCLSKSEMEQCKAQGLCFNCDEKYLPGHLCKRLFWLEVEDPEEDSPPPDEETPDEEEPAISIHAMIGLHSTNTMQVHAGIQNFWLLALVDSVANGEKLTSIGLYSAVQFVIEGHDFAADFLVIPLAGFDLVLGIKWLQQLGLILWDFTSLTMGFTSGQHHITLHGTHAPSLCALHHLQAADSDRSHLHSLIAEFGDLFMASQSLPPIRNCDHQIRLQMGMEPVVVRPYHYPHFQKDEIERQCHQMLEQGLIQASWSPIASPVLLVKKNDHTWRFCVDYRELNAHTVKDKFPIPVVNELLDELHGAKFFTKLDLRSGYHQIHVYPADVEKAAFRTQHGHFEFLVMPFGLSMAPSTFQALMNDVFRPLLRKFVLVFFDDILIYSSSWEGHL